MKYANQDMFNNLSPEAQNIVNKEKDVAEALYPTQVKIGDGFEPNASRDAHMRVFAKSLVSKVASIKMTIERSNKASSVQGDKDKADMALALHKQQIDLWKSIGNFIAIEFAKPIKVQTSDEWSISA